MMTMMYVSCESNWNTYYIVCCGVRWMNMHVTKDGCLYYYTYVCTYFGSLHTLPLPT